MLSLVLLLRKEKQKQREKLSKQIQRNPNHTMGDSRNMATNGVEIIITEPDENGATKPGEKHKRKLPNRPQMDNPSEINIRKVGLHKNHTMAFDDSPKNVSLVVANFSAELDALYRPSSAPASSTGSKTNKSISFDRVPTMLLPKARPRVRQNLIDYLRSVTKSGKVIPMDPTSSIEISSLYGTSLLSEKISEEGPRRGSTIPRYNIPKNPTVRLVDPMLSNSDGYLDNFAGTSDVLQWLKGAGSKRPRPTTSWTDGGALFDKIPCLQCRQLLIERGIKDDDVTDWWHEARKNFQPLPKHNNVRQGTVPHFCNFVRNKVIHDRESTPSPVRGRSRSVSPNTAGSEYSGSRGRYSRSRSSVSPGAEARPSSPSTEGPTSDLDELESEVLAEVPRIRVSRRKHSSPISPGRKGSGSPDQGKSQKEKTPKIANPSNKHDRSKCSTKPAVPRRTSEKSIVTDEDTTGRYHDISGDDTTLMDKLANPVTAVEQTDPLSTSLTEQEDESLHPPASSIRTQTNGNASPTPSQGHGGGKKPRAPPKKKEKKAFERKRQVSVEAVPEITEVKEEEAEPEVIEESVPDHRPPPPPEIKVPELPKFVPREEPPAPRKPAVQKPAPPRTKIVTGPPVFKQPTVKDILEQELRNQRIFDFPATLGKKMDTAPKPTSTTWTQGRLALSQQSSRFELPMDMKLLETMLPVEYLSKYCVVTSKRKWLYEKIYLKHKDAKLGGLSLKGLEKALKEALVDTITTEEVAEMIEMIQLTESSKIDQKLFVGIAAMTERLLYPRFLTEDTQNIKDHKKEKIECADFCGLEWKFHGIDVNPHMRKILESL